MSKYVPDILSRRWVIISGQRLSRPDDYAKKQTHVSNVCIFCPGNEHMVPSEVFRIGEGEKDKSGWQVRVIPNKYPITDFHEVFILSPDCHKQLHELPEKHVGHIITAYRERYNFYRKKGQVMIFSNHGEHAGASIEHPHSQLVVIPSQINLDTLSREPLSNMVEENEFFNVYCPDFSQWPYEVWIAAKEENTVFGDIKDQEISDLAPLLIKYLKKLQAIYKKHQISHIPFGYNFYIHPKESWYIRIIPRFVERAGFELGTGLSVNVVDPTDAAEQFKDQEDKTKDVLKKLQGHIRK